MIVVDGETETRYYYHYDGLGSVIALSNENSEIEESYSYEVYGRPSSVSSLGNPYFFTARRLDTETGLYYYRARIYNATIGRFLQTDPIGYEDSMNLYSYVGNGPINFIDPSGLCRNPNVGSFSNTWYPSNPNVRDPLSRNYTNPVTASTLPLTIPASQMWAGTAGSAAGSKVAGSLAGGLLGGVVAHVYYNAGLEIGNRLGTRNLTAIPVGYAYGYTLVGIEKAQEAWTDVSHWFAEHTKGKRKSTTSKHERGQRRSKTDKGREKGDARRPYKR